MAFETIKMQLLGLSFTVDVDIPEGTEMYMKKKLAIKEANRILNSRPALKLIKNT